MAQIQKGTTYGATAPDNLVTYTNLNAHVDSAILLPGAITDQTTLATTASGDYALVSDTDASGALKKVTLANLIPDSGIATAKIADDAVTNAKLADDAVDSPQIADGAIDAVHLASDSVTTAKILDGNVTAAKLASTLDLSGKTLTLPAVPAAVVTGRGTDGVCTLPDSNGIASVTRNGSGVYDVVFSVARASANYIPLVATTSTGAIYPYPIYSNKTTSGFTVSFRYGGLIDDPTEFGFVIHEL